MSKAQELAAQLDKEQIDTVRRDVMNHEAADLLRTQDALLRQALEALDIAFGYEGDVFGKQHNNVTDTFVAINEHLK